MPQKNAPRRQFIPRTVKSKKIDIEKLASKEAGTRKAIEARCVDINEANDKAERSRIQEFQRHVEEWSGNGAQAYCKRTLANRGWTRSGAEWKRHGITLNSTEGIASDPLSAAVARMIRRFAHLSMILNGKDLSEGHILHLLTAYNAGETYGEWSALSAVTGRPSKVEQDQAAIYEAYERYLGDPRNQGRTPLLKELKGMCGSSEKALTRWRSNNRGKTSRD